MKFKKINADVKANVKQSEIKNGWLCHVSFY